MPLRPFFSVPKSLREWSEWCRNTTVEPGDGTVTESMLTDNAVSNRALRDSEAYSVIGNPTNTGADPSDIAAGADGTFLGRRSGALQFVALQDSDIPSSIARDAEVTTAVTAGITTHSAAADPHTVYPLAAGPETISGAWTFTTTVVVDGTTAASSPVSWRVHLDGTLRGLFGVAGLAGGLITGSSTNDICVRAQGSSILFSADSGSNIHFKITSSLVHVPQAFRMDVSTTTTAPSAGGAGALPATPAGYATVNIGGTDRKIAYY